MMPRPATDPADLGRGPLTHWMPVFLQARPSPPTVEPYPIRERTSPRRFLVRVIFSAKRLSVPAALLAIVWQVGESLVPIIMGAAIDQALDTGDAARLGLWLGILAANFLVLSFAYRFSAQLSANATERVEHRLRATLSRSVLHPAEGAARRPDGRLVSTMTNDVTRLAAVGLTVYPVAEVAGVIFIAVSLLVINWQLGLTVLIGAPVAVWLMVAMSGRLSRDTAEYQSLLAETVGQATDLVTGYRVIKGIRAEEEATRRYRDASRRTLSGARRNIRLLGRFVAGSSAVSAVFTAGVAIAAAWFALTGQLTVGGLIAAVGLAQALLAPMQMLAQNAVPMWATALASSSRVLDTLREFATQNGPHQQTSPSLSALPEVTVSLDSIRAIRVAPGELIGVRADDRVAADLTSALLNPGAAPAVRVELDRTPAAGLTPEDYRSRVVVLPHHSALFSGSVADNLDVPGSTRRSRERALTAAMCDDFLTESGGLERPVGEMGNRFSGGQRQRLALAGALATAAPVLVLHEPTTAVDSVTEAAIASRLRQLRAGRSTILIASSPALLSVCSRIVDLYDTDRNLEA